MSPELDTQLCTRHPEIFAKRNDPEAPIALGDRNLRLLV